MTTIFDLLLSSTEVNFNIEFEVANMLEGMSLNDLNKLEHSYGGYETYKYRLEPMIMHNKFRLLGGKL